MQPQALDASPGDVKLEGGSLQKSAKDAIGGGADVGQLEGEGSQGANRGADSKELEDAYR